MMKVAETTDSLLNEHRENCQIGLSYIKCTALRHKLLPFVKLRTQIFFQYTISTWLEYGIPNKNIFAVL